MGIQRETLQLLDDLEPRHLDTDEAYHVLEVMRNLVSTQDCLAQLVNRYLKSSNVHFARILSGLLVSDERPTNEQELVLAFSIYNESPSREDRSVQQNISSALETQTVKGNRFVSQKPYSNLLFEFVRDGLQGDRLSVGAAVSLLRHLLCADFLSALVDSQRNELEATLLSVNEESYKDSLMELLGEVRNGKAPPQNK